MRIVQALQALQSCRTANIACPQNRREHIVPSASQSTSGWYSSRFLLQDMTHWGHSNSALCRRHCSTSSRLQSRLSGSTEVPLQCGASGASGTTRASLLRIIAPSRRASCSTPRPGSLAVRVCPAEMPAWPQGKQLSIATAQPALFRSNALPRRRLHFPYLPPMHVLPRLPKVTWPHGTMRSI